MQFSCLEALNGGLDPRLNYNQLESLRLKSYIPIEKPITTQDVTTNLSHSVRPHLPSLPPPLTHPSSLYFLPPTPDQPPPSTTLTTHLTTLYNPTPLPPWSLTHRLFRETPLPTTLSHDKSKPPPPSRYLQTLTLSHHAPRTYIAITSTHAPPQTRAGTPADAAWSTSTGGSDPATLISLPTSPSSEEFITLLLTKYGPLWQQRQILGIVNGQGFEIDDFRVRIGEVRQAGGGVGGGGPGQMMGIGKGAVCEVEWVGGEEGDLEGAGEVIAGFWEGLGVKGGRKVYEVPGVREGDGSVRQWFEGLRVRG